MLLWYLERKYGISYIVSYPLCSVVKFPSTAIFLMGKILTWLKSCFTTLRKKTELKRLLNSSTDTLDKTDIYQHPSSDLVNGVCSTSVSAISVIRIHRGRGIPPEPTSPPPRALLKKAVHRSRKLAVGDDYFRRADVFSSICMLFLILLFYPILPTLSLQMYNIRVLEEDMSENTKNVQ